jgi:hypothetical protein
LLLTYLSRFAFSDEKKNVGKNECAEETHGWGNFTVMIALTKGECKKGIRLGLDQSFCMCSAKAGMYQTYKNGV